MILELGDSHHRTLQSMIILSTQHLFLRRNLHAKSRSMNAPVISLLSSSSALLKVIAQAEFELIFWKWPANSHVLSVLCPNGEQSPDGFYGGINSKNAKPGRIICIDPAGPISPDSICGYSPMLLDADEIPSILPLLLCNFVWTVLNLSFQTKFCSPIVILV